VQQVKLVASLFMDKRVHWATKLIPIASLGYLFFPIDGIPDVIPVLGQLDDIGVVLLGIRFFFEFIPQDIVREHLLRITSESGGTPAASATPPPPVAPADDIVEGEVKDS
jgi:uncharacterized membrane protein YkvA (DUF1232 family)